MDNQRFQKVITHPGSAHKDEFLACCLLLAENPVPIFRRDPVAADLEDAQTAVVDIGGEHDAERGNFDHHQFPREYVPTCSLSLVLMDMELYEDARKYCEWLEVAEWFDTRGPMETAAWLGVDRSLLAKLNSTIDLTLLRRFSGASELNPGDVLWEVMRWVGCDMVGYLRSLREKLAEIKKTSAVWEIGHPAGAFRVLFLERSKTAADDASAGLGRYAAELPEGEEVVAMVYPDRRGGGYALSRYNDHPWLDFTRVEAEADVHFAHARGFVAKTSAVDEERLRELIGKSWEPIGS